MKYLIILLLIPNIVFAGRKNVKIGVPYRCNLDTTRYHPESNILEIDCLKKVRTKYLIYIEVWWNVPISFSFHVQGNLKVPKVLAITEDKK